MSEVKATHSKLLDHWTVCQDKTANGGKQGVGKVCCMQGCPG